MSKGLEALNDLRTFSDCLATNKSFPKIVIESECYDAIEKELKALEIIKEKHVDIHALLCIYETLDGYNNAYNFKLSEEEKEWCVIPKKLTKKEYDLLKEVLE